VFSVYGGKIGIYAGWSIAVEVATDAGWTFDEFAEAMNTLPRTVEVNSQLEMLQREMAGGAS
jgi:hypothetical protein